MRRLVLPATILAIATACGTSPDEPGTPGLTIVARPPATDTIQAIPAQAIVVEVRGDDGAPLTGEVIRFEAGLNPSGHATMLVSHPAARQWDLLAVDTVDARGRAAALVQFWTLVGSGSVVVKVPVRGLVDTVRFTVSPGALAGVDIRQQDTAVARGTTLALRSSAFDRGGNPLTEPITYSLRTTPSSLATVSATGDFAATGSLGTAIVFASAAGKRDSVVVTVFPRGQIVRYELGAQRIVLADVAGGQPQTLLSIGSDVGSFSWSSDASLLAFQSNFGPQILGSNGELRNLFEQTPSQLNSPVSNPVFASGSTNLYFSATGTSDAGAAIWRARVDGTSLERITDGPGHFDPSPSPDGRFLAYSVFDPAVNQNVIRTYDLTTKSTTPVKLTGIGARWSPRGDLIAYYEPSNSGVYIVRPDGTGRRRLTEELVYYALSWSPGGEFLLVPRPFVMTVIDVGSGLVVPVNTSLLSFNAAWRPEPVAARSQP